MKKIISLILGLFLFSQMPAQGINFFEGSFEEALELAKQEDKMIFVDAYTTWCGPCKRMKKYIFPNKKAGDLYNKYFINMAIDMEKQMGKQFNMTYPVKSYPTLLFINSDGEIVLREGGAKPIELFLQIGESALKADDKTEKYAKFYEEGNRDFDFMLKYVVALNRAEKSSSKIVYDYLNHGPKLGEDDKAKFIYEATSSCDSKIFDMLTASKTKKKIIQIYGKDKFLEKIHKVCWATVKKGMEFNVTELYEEARSKYKKQDKKSFPKFSCEIDLAVAKRKQDASAYLKAANKYVKQLEEGEDKNKFALESKDLFLRDDGIASFVEGVSKKVLKGDNSIDNNFAYAKILLKNKKYDLAIPYLEKAIEMANVDKTYPKMRELKQIYKMASKMK